MIVTGQKSRVKSGIYLTVKETGEKWGITSRMETVYCNKGRIPGAIKKGNLWLVPNDSIKPTDNRCKNNKSED